MTKQYQLLPVRRTLVGDERKLSVMTFVPPATIPLWTLWRLRMEVMAVEVFCKWRWVEIAMPHNSTETVLQIVVGGCDYSYEDHPFSLVVWLFGCLFGSTSNYGG
jgi:hypothetical protein